MDLGIPAVFAGPISRFRGRTSRDSEEMSSHAELSPRHSDLDVAEPEVVKSVHRPPNLPPCADPLDGTSPPALTVSRQKLSPLAAWD